MVTLENYATGGFDLVANVEEVASCAATCLHRIDGWRLGVEMQLVRCSVALGLPAMGHAVVITR